MKKGYIKIWRKSLDSAMWQNLNVWRTFEYCLLKARHKPGMGMVGYREIPLLAGQFIFGRKIAAVETGLSEQKIRSSIDYLRKAKKVTIKSTNKYSIITIINWHTYQNQDKKNNHQITIKPPSSHQQLTTNKNVKNVKKKAKEKELTKSISLPGRVVDVDKPYFKSFNDKLMHINKLIDDIKLLPPKFEQGQGFSGDVALAQWIRARKHPDAIIKTFERLIRSWDGIQFPWNYANTMLDQESATKNERDHTRASKKIKQFVEGDIPKNLERFRDLFMGVE